MSINEVFIIIISYVVGVTAGHFLGAAFCKLYDYIKSRKEDK